MSFTLRLGFMGLALAAALAGGCGGPYEDAVSATLLEINPIIKNEDLSPEQKRAALENLGLPSQVINALLREERLVNQDGGDLRSAYEKLTSSRFNELTPDEVQIFADAASEAGEGVNLTLTDVQAAAIVDFFRQNAITSRSQLSEFLDDPARAASISSDIPENALNDLFVSFDLSVLLDKLP